MDASALKEYALALLAVISSVGVTVLTFRGKKNESDTQQQNEISKQAGIGVYMEQLKAVSEALLAERLRATEAAKAAEERESDLRQINSDVRDGFNISFTEFQRRIGVLLEDAAELRGRCEALQADKQSLQESHAAMERNHGEDKRSQAQHYEGMIKLLQLDVDNLKDRVHILTNLHYGDGTATNVMGER